MEKQINRLLRFLQVEYFLFWLLTALLVAAYELEILPMGFLIADSRASYILEVLGILLAVSMIPLSLRLFNMSLIRYVQQYPLERALVSYRRWSEVRIALLLVPALINLAVYYWTLQTTGLLCVAMVLIASLFCVPSKRRIQMELNLEKDEKEEL